LGNLLYSAESKRDLPSVGDWVAILEYDEGKAIIHEIFPRYGILERQAVGKKGEKQIIGANLDYAIIVQSGNRDFSVNRIQRYMSLVLASGIQPMIVITKIDLLSQNDLENLLKEVKIRIQNVPILSVSNETGEGVEAVNRLIQGGKTYCLLGSSGVGKSSLINSLIGEDRMVTGEISESIDRGKHVTTHRELIPLVNGGILIDNPGMREVGMIENPEGLGVTFEEITSLAKECKFSDCTHTTEIGCAVLKAVEEGGIDSASLENFFKLEKESAYFTSTMQERKAKDKKLGKMIDEVKRLKKGIKFRD
jgi:ribosome biogenesis GTPase / thiamine phosphate phosphatase